MSKRISTLLVGLLVMLIGIGFFLWDWYGEYIHFIWFIPFFVLGPIMFVAGVIVVVRALSQGKTSSKETMPPKESTENVHRYPIPPMYCNEKYGFSIQPPSGWEVVGSGLKKGTAVVFWGPKERYFAPNIIIAVTDAPDVTLDEHVSMAKQGLPLVLTNYRLVSEGSKVTGGLDAHELVYNYTMGAFGLKGKRVFLLKNEKVYMISFTALQGNYDRYLPVFENSC